MLLHLVNLSIDLILVYWVKLMECQLRLCYKHLI